MTGRPRGNPRCPDPCRGPDASSARGPPASLADHARLRRATRTDTTGHPTNGIKIDYRKELSWQTDPTPRVVSRLAYSDRLRVETVIGFVWKVRSTWLEYARYASRGERVVNVMGEVMADLVGARVFRYRDLGFDEPFDHRARVGRGKARIVLVTEKEGVWKYLLLFYNGELEDPSAVATTKKPKPVLHFKSISAMASNGQPSLLALEYFAQSLWDKGVRTLLVGALCDLDPWGYEIALSYTEKFHFLGFKEVTTHLLTRPDWFTPEQIAAGRDLSNLSTASERALAQKWLEKTGGVNGKLVGLHLDVINKAKLLLNIYHWVKEALKDDNVPGYPVLVPKDAAAVRQALSVRGRLLPDGTLGHNPRTLRNLR